MFSKIVQFCGADPESIDYEQVAKVLFIIMDVFDICLIITICILCIVALVCLIAEFAGVKIDPASTNNDDDKDEEVNIRVRHVSDLRRDIETSVFCAIFYFVFFGLIGRLGWDILIPVEVGICSSLALRVAFRHYMRRRRTAFGEGDAEAAQHSKLEGGQVQQSKDLDEEKVQVGDVEEDFTSSREKVMKV